jgi:pimeloyl-ACP methyl ester carboxylesterase
MSMRAHARRDSLWPALGLALLAALPEAALAKPSCGKGGPAGETVGTAGSGQYRINVPSNYTATQAIPLLLALHGDEGTPDYIYSAFKSLQQSSKGAYILVAPKAPFGGGSWYQATTQHTDFVNTVISTVLGLYNIDQDRLWITGWSGGSTFGSYYAIKRQDILAAVVLHMGGGGGGAYSPPAGSCKIPVRFVIGDQDFLYSLAQPFYNTLKQNGHDVVWIELPGVGHDFQPSTVPDTWAWLQAKTLCGKTTPGSCGPASDGPAPRADGGSDAAPRAEGGAPGDASGGDGVVILRDGEPRRGRPTDGCECAVGDLDAPVSLAGIFLLLAIVVRASRTRH